MLGPSLADIKKRRVLITRLSLVGVTWKITRGRYPRNRRRVTQSEVSRDRPLFKIRPDLFVAIYRRFVCMYTYTRGLIQKSRFSLLLSINSDKLGLYIKSHYIKSHNINIKSHNKIKMQRDFRYENVAILGIKFSLIVQSVCTNG